jgi:hypothetical protein
LELAELEARTGDDSPDQPAVEGEDAGAFRGVEEARAQLGSGAGEM